MSISSSFSKEHPFLASIKEKRWLSKPGSEKRTYHIVLDLKNSGFHYHPGDCIGVHPTNPRRLIARTLEAIRATGEEIVTDKQGLGSYTLSDFLASKANLTGISRKFLSEIAARQTSPEKKEHILRLLSEGNKDALKSYLENHEVWDLLLAHAEVIFTPQEVINLLMPLLPRLYSIASSQRIVGDEVHLMVSRLCYISNSHNRLGICTHYLCDTAPFQELVVPIYVQAHHGFTLPENSNTDMIMIGPGTGVAPFKAFMEERVALEAKGKNWLFFGECHRDLDFFYEEYWNSLQERGLLEVDTAFSRDQAFKIYVQHRMLEKGAQIFEWLQRGAALYVCGDAHHMAKDVDAALHQIIEQYGSKSESEARVYVKEMRANERYLRDIY